MTSGGVASALRRLASSFLTRCSASAPEAEVLDYLTGVLEDGEADVDALVRAQAAARAHLLAPSSTWASFSAVALLGPNACTLQADIVSGFVPAFGALPEAEREAALVALLDEALCAKLAAQASCADPPPQQPAAPPRATAQPEQPVRGAMPRGRAAPRETNPSGALTTRLRYRNLQPRRGADAAACDPAVDTLAALRPSLPPEFLAHALRSRFRGDAHAAAAWLLDGAAEADAAHAAWARERDEQRREEEEAAAAREALRSGILERCACQWLPKALAVLRETHRYARRYDIQVVSAAAGGGGVVTPAGPTLGARRSGAADDAPPKQRYHGGQIVAQRGEKYIVEKVRHDPGGGGACALLGSERVRSLGAWLTDTGAWRHRTTADA